MVHRDHHRFARPSGSLRTISPSLSLESLPTPNQSRRGGISLLSPSRRTPQLSLTSGFPFVVPAFSPVLLPSLCFCSGPDLVGAAFWSAAACRRYPNCAF